MWARSLTSSTSLLQVYPKIPKVIKLVNKPVLRIQEILGTDPDPCIHASLSILAYYFLKVYLHHFSKIKSHKKSQNCRNQRFSYYFCLMIEGSRAGSRDGSGSVPRTDGSGSGRPKTYATVFATLITATYDVWGPFGQIRKLDRVEKY